MTTTTEQLCNIIFDNSTSCCQRHQAAIRGNPRQSAAIRVNPRQFWHTTPRTKNIYIGTSCNIKSTTKSQQNFFLFFLQNIGKLCMKKHLCAVCALKQSVFKNFSSLGGVMPPKKTARSLAEGDAWMLLCQSVTTSLSSVSVLK